MVAKIPILGYPLDIEQSLIRHPIISHVHIYSTLAIYNLNLGHWVLPTYEGLNMSKLYFRRFSII